MVLSYLGITRLKSVLEDAQNLQVQLILLTCRVSSGSLLSIDTFCSMILLVDSEGPDQITQLWSGPCCMHMLEDTFLHGAADLNINTCPAE